MVCQLLDPRPGGSIGFLLLFHAVDHSSLFGLEKTLYGGQLTLGVDLNLRVGTELLNRLHIYILLS